MLLCPGTTPRSPATTSWPWPSKGAAPLNQIAKDLGISEGCLHNWLKRGGVADANRLGATVADAAELCEARTRIKLLEQENEVLRLGVRGSG
jgi:transposase-like protein